MSSAKLTQKLVDSGLPIELARLIASGDIENALWQWETGSKFSEGDETSTIRKTLHKVRTRMARELENQANEMPIYGTHVTVPWEVVQEHRHSIQRNTGQPPEVMRDSGGMTPCEMLAALEDRSVTKIPVGDALNRIQLIISDFKVRQNDLLTKPIVDEIEQLALTYDIIAAQGNGIVGARQVSADIRMNVIPAIKRFFAKK